MTSLANKWTELNANYLPLYVGNNDYDKLLSMVCRKLSDNHLYLFMWAYDSATFGGRFRYQHDIGFAPISQLSLIDDNLKTELSADLLVDQLATDLSADQLTVHPLASLCDGQVVEEINLPVSGLTWQNDLVDPGNCGMGPLFIRTEDGSTYLEVFQRRDGFQEFAADYHTVSDEEANRIMADVKLDSLIGSADLPGRAHLNFNNPDQTYPAVTIYLIRKGGEFYIKRMYDYTAAARYFESLNNRLNDDGQPLYPVCLWTDEQFFYDVCLPYEKVVEVRFATTTETTQLLGYKHRRQHAVNYHKWARANIAHFNQLLATTYTEEAQRRHEEKMRPELERQALIQELQREQQRELQEQQQAELDRDKAARGWTIMAVSVLSWLNSGH